MSLPGIGPESVISVEDVASLVRSATPGLHMPTRVLAVDGCGGSGKSTLASSLSESLSHAPIVRTDDFASWNNQFDWWPRLLDQVLVPLAAGEVARYQRFDWVEDQLADWLELPLLPQVVIIEGVSSSRSEFAPYLAFRIWVEASVETRLRRGLERDGESMRDQWLAWMAGEDAYVARDDPVGRADLVVSGEPVSALNPTREIAVLRTG